MTQQDEQSKAYSYYEVLNQAVRENNREVIEKAERMANNIDFTQVSQGLLDKIDKLYEHENFRE